MNMPNPQMITDLLKLTYKKILFYYSPSGKLVQIEYALAAVAAGAPSVGIKGNNLHTQIYIYISSI